MPALAVANDRGASAPPANPVMQNFRSKARWAKPMPKAHKNWIPQTAGWYGYQWIDRDPELDFVLHCIEESGHTLEWIEQETERRGHKTSRWTLLAWFYKGTRQPKNVTMNNVMAAIGYERQWKRV
jgi:hypothetical protein